MEILSIKKDPGRTQEEKKNKCDLGTRRKSVAGSHVQFLARIHQSETVRYTKHDLRLT